MKVLVVYGGPYNGQKKENFERKFNGEQPKQTNIKYLTTKNQSYINTINKMLET